MSGLHGPRNVDRYLRGSGKLDLSGFDWAAVADHPLSAHEVRCLAYMMDVETHTVVFLRDLLATRAALDPEITAFLACWAYEELWHGEAISRFLGEAGAVLPPDGKRTHWDDPYPSRAARTGWVRGTIATKGYASHLATLAGSAAFRDFPAVHMAWGAVNELSTMTSYQRLIAGTHHPLLADLLTRIVRDERRHYSFYRSEADRRLSATAQARRLTRWALGHLWAIVGTGIRPVDETDFVVLHLFGDEGGGLAAARGMDAAIDALPGLQGLGLFQRARTEALSRRGPGRAALADDDQEVQLKAAR
ncbi:MAG: hypothetical protein QOH36_729 [Actinomycetota bacterium]|nr:hypothetical protein [Actinomycetota bacterium]